MVLQKYPPVGGWYDFNSVIVPRGTVAAKLGEYNSPEIPIIIQGHEFIALIDTGAYYCCIRRDLFEELRMPIFKKSIVSSPVEGTTTRDLTILYFSIKGITGDFFEECNVIEEFKYPIILGTNFLQKCESFTYYGKENRFELVI